MLGQAISMVLPEVVGCKLVGEIGPLVTSTDVVLTITKVCVCVCGGGGGDVGVTPLFCTFRSHLHALS
jgi:hypothetical protein